MPANATYMTIVPTNAITPVQKIIDQVYRGFITDMKKDTINTAVARRKDGTGSPRKAPAFASPGLL